MIAGGDDGINEFGGNDVSFNDDHKTMIMMLTIMMRTMEIPTMMMKIMLKIYV